MPDRLELEDALGFASLEELEGLRGRPGEARRCRRRLGMALVDEPHGRVEGGEVAQAEEVHLQQAGLLDIAHLPLGA